MVDDGSGKDRPVAPKAKSKESKKNPYGNAKKNVSTGDVSVKQGGRHISAEDRAKQLAGDSKKPQAQKNWEAIEKQSGVIRDERGNVVYAPSMSPEAINKAREEDAKRAEEQARQRNIHGRGGGSVAQPKHYKINLSDSLGISDSAKPTVVKRSSKNISKYLEQQESKISKLESEISERQKTVAEYQEQIKKIESQPLPKRKFTGRYYGKGVPIYSYSDADRVQAQKSKAREAVQEKIAKESAKINQYNKEIANRKNTIEFFEKELKSVKKQDYFKKQADYQTAETTPTSSGVAGIPPAPATASVSAIPVVDKTVEKFKDYFGISEKPKGRNIQVNLQESLQVSEGTPQKKSEADKFLPTYYETAKIPYTTARFGYDPNYLSTSDPSKATPKNKDSVFPYLQAQDAPTVPLTERKQNRGIEGAKAVPENFYQLGKESVEGITSDIEKGELGTKQPTELKKDIVISGIGVITDPLQTATDPLDYFQKVDKKAKEFGADLQRDSAYWTSNIGANIELAVASVGVAPASKAVYVGARNTLRNLGSQNRAKVTLEYLHPPKTETKNVAKYDSATGGLKIEKKTLPESELVHERKPKKSSDPDLQIEQDYIAEITETKPTGTVRQQPISQVESIKKIGNYYGYDTYEFAIKDGTQTKTGVITMTPNPVVRYFTKPSNLPRTVAETEKVVKFDAVTGQEIQKKIRDNPTQAHEFYKQAIQEGKAQVVEKPTSPEAYYLASLADESGTARIPNRSLGTFEDVKLNRGEFGKSYQVSETEAKYLGAQGTDVFDATIFTRDELAQRLAKNSQYMNEFATGKRKVAEKPTETYSIDSEYYAPDFFKGETSIPTAYAIDTKIPTQFKKATPYEKLENDLNLKRLLERPSKDGKPMKPFDLDEYSKQVLDSDTPTQQVAKQKPQADTKDYFDVSAQTKQDSSYPSAYATDSSYSSDYGFEYDYVTINDKAPKYKGGFDYSVNQNLISPPKEKTDEKLKTNVIPVTVDLMALDNLIKPIQVGKQKPDEIPKFDFRIIPDVYQTPDEDTTYRYDVEETPVTDTPQITETIYDVPELPPETPPEIPEIFRNTRPPADLPVPFGFSIPEWLQDDYQNPSKAKQFWNTDPMKVLGFFPSKLGYQSKEFSQIKKKRKKDDDFIDFENIGF